MIRDEYSWMKYTIFSQVCINGLNTYCGYRTLSSSSEPSENLKSKESTFSILLHIQNITVGHSEMVSIGSVWGADAKL